MENRIKTKREILLKVQNNEISPEEAYKLLLDEKEQQKKVLEASQTKSNVVLYKNVWKKKDAIAKLSWDGKERISVYGSAKWELPFCNDFQNVQFFSIDRVMEENPVSISSEKLVYLWDTDSAIKEENRENQHSVYEAALKEIDRIRELVQKIHENPGCKVCYIMYPCKGLDTNPYASCLRGFTKSLKRVIPQLEVRVIGIDNMDNCTAIVEKEFKSDSEGQEICYIGQERYVKTVEKVNALEKKEIALKERGVYLITGGAGGLGRIFASHLLNDYHATVIITGRKKENEEIQTFISKQPSGKCVYMQTDVTSLADTIACIDKIIMDYGKLDGVIHATGVSDEIDVFSKDREQFHRILEPKIKGLTTLEKALSNVNLDFIAAFSSTSAILGDFGQCDYAIANCFMDSFMQNTDETLMKDTRIGKRICINWPMWREGGMHSKQNPEGEKLYLKTSGLSYLETEDGVKIFDDILSSNESQVIVMCGEEEKADKILLEKHTGKEEHIVNREIPKEIPKEKTGKKITLQEIQNKVTAIAAELIDLPVERYDETENFGEYGYDSITLKELADKIGEEFQIELPQTVFFAYSNVSDLCKYLWDEFGTVICTAEKQDNEKEEQIEQPMKQSKEQIKTDLQETAQNRYDAKEYESAVAIIGASGIFPGAANLDEFWDNLRNGVDGIVEIPKERWDSAKYYCADDMSGNYIKTKRGGFIQDVDKFDAPFFHISPLEAEMMDPQQRLYLQEVWKSIETSGYKASALSGRQIGVFTGVQFSDYQQLIFEQMSEVHPLVGTGNSHAMISNRVSYFLNLKGPSEAIDTACSGSLVAVHRAIDSIRNGESEMAIAGGVSLMLSPANLLGAGKMGILSPDGKCKTFDKSANGYGKGEGVGAVLLKPLKQAIKDKDCIWAIIRNSSEMHGGRANSLTAPNSSSQAALITKAYTDAKIPPETIAYVEAHGTGTALGDPVEIDGLKMAFDQMYKLENKKMNQAGYCGLGSVKSNIGHLEPASGIAGIMKVILSFQHKVLPKTIHLHDVNPLIEINDSPFYFVTETKDWKHLVSDNGELIPYRAGVSSFGFGGAYAHVVLEEFISEQKQDRTDFSDAIIPLSAQNKESLMSYVREMKEYLKKNLSTDLYNMSYTLIDGRENMKEKVIFIGSEAATFVSQMEEFLANGGKQSSFDGKDEGVVRIAQDWKNNNMKAMEQLPYWNQSQKMVLPVYPFEKKSYWLHGDKVENLNDRITSSLTVLADSNVSTLEEQLYKKTFYGTEYYLAAHGQMFPAGLYLEMPRECGELAIPQGKVAALEDVQILSPVTILENQDKEVFVKLIPEKEFVWYELFTYGLEYKRIMHAKGKLYYELGFSNPERIDVKACLQHMNGGGKEAKDYYQKLEERGQKTGMALQTMKEFYCNADEALVKISEDMSLCEATKECLFHPACFDGGIHGILTWIQKQNQDDTIVHLLKTIGKVSIFNSDSNPVYGYLQKTGESYSISYLDGDGAVIWKAEGVLFASIENRVSTKSKNISKQSESEENLAEVFSSFLNEVTGCIEAVLHMSSGSVQEDSELALLGLDSLTYTQLSDEMNRMYKLQITPALFFGNSTPKDIAESVYDECKEQIDNYYMNEVPVQSANVQIAKEHSKEEKDDKVIEHVTGPRFLTKQVTAKEEGPEPVAIVGICGKFPQSEDLIEYWNNLYARKDLVTEIPEDRWDWRDYYGKADMVKMKTPYKWGGFMKNIDGFDAGFFNISPMEAEMMDPQARLILETVWKAIEDAGYRPSSLSGTATGLYIGVTNEDYKDILLQNNMLAIMTPSLIANRISFLLNLRGPSEPVDTACSSALVALHKAVESIQYGRCEMAIAGGVNVIASPNLYISQGTYGMLSKEGKCKTFDEDADGYVRGEGVGAVLLKPLSRAVKDKDHIYAVIRGISINHGGHGSSLTAPNSTAQAEVIVDAVKRSGVDPATIQYIESHGTGTSLGDPVEIEGLKKAYKVLLKGQTIKEHSIGIGAVKTNIGHLESASGMASLMKVLLCLKNKKFLPLIHFNKLNSYISLDRTPFYIMDKEAKWDAITDEKHNKIPRRAAISAFGMGGVNAHIVLEEHEQEKIVECKNRRNLYVFSAKTKESLMKIIEKTYEYLDNCHNDADTSEGNVNVSEELLETIHSICAALLKVDVDELDVNESLYEAGFDLMKREQLFETLEQNYQITIDRSKISICDTVKTISESIYENGKTRVDAYSKKTVDKKDGTSVNMDSLAYTLQNGREQFQVKAAFIASSLEELLQKMNGFIHQDSQGNGEYYSWQQTDNDGSPALFKSKEGKQLVERLVMECDLEQIAKLWLQDVEIPWTLLYEEIPYRMSLPTYQFSDKRYWVNDRVVNPPADFKKESREHVQAQIEETELSDEELMDVLHNVENGVIDGTLAAALLEGKNYL